MLRPSVQQGGLNSRESDVRNVPASDVQWSMKDEYVLLLNILPGSSAVKGRIFPFFSLFTQGIFSHLLPKRWEHSLERQNT